MSLKTVAGKKLDVTAHEIRYRILNPDKVQVVGRKQISEGVSIVVSCPKRKVKRNRCTVGTTAQALRFDRDIFTPGMAAKWIENNWRR